MTAESLPPEVARQLPKLHAAQRQGLPHLIMHLTGQLLPLRRLGAHEPLRQHLKLTLLPQDPDPLLRWRVTSS